MSEIEVGEYIRTKKGLIDKVKDIHIHCKEYCTILIGEKTKYWLEDMYELIQIIKRNQERDKKIIKYLEQEINVSRTQWITSDGYVKSEIIKSKYVDRKVYAREILGIFEGKENE
ncbi:MAG: hypothetical protein HFJ48_01660 [Clostridia bacterium]|nr:hypothetical protein [Clostridia bacterium]